MIKSILSALAAILWLTGCHNENEHRASRVEICQPLGAYLENVKFYSSFYVQSGERAWLASCPSVSIRIEVIGSDSPVHEKMAHDSMNIIRDGKYVALVNGYIVKGDGNYIFLVTDFREIKQVNSFPSNIPYSE